MKVFVLVCSLLWGTTWCLGDAVSGPGHLTLQRFSWGTLYIDSAACESYQLEPTSNGYLLRTKDADVAIQGSEINGYQLSCGKDWLTLSQSFADLDVQGPGQHWTWSSRNGQYTLTSSEPKDTVVFHRDANHFSIKGAKGVVAGTQETDTFLLKSPQGLSTLSATMGTRTVAGVPLSRIPYLGRGVFIPFHGVGIFIDISKAFPMPEVAEWIEWREVVLGP